MRIFLFTTLLIFFTSCQTKMDGGLKIALESDGINDGISYYEFDGIDFVKIERGCFQMGSNSGDGDEKPVHEVCVNKDFYLGKTEVTQAQWEAVMDSNPSYFKGDSLPVEKVSWEEITKTDGFLDKLNKKAGGSYYRLPTEAEWEYAARAGTTTRYPFADDKTKLEKYAWFSNNSGSKTHSVAIKLHNFWGLYDMCGNVSEWVYDQYGSTYYNKKIKNDPTGNESGDERIHRGGGWITDDTRPADRSYLSPDSAYNDLGFRLLRQFQ